MDHGQQPHAGHTSLWLHTNGLAGPIPRELGAATELEDLRLHGNQLTGSIPSELATLTKMTSLTLHSSPMLSGSVPPELCDLTLLNPTLNVSIDCDQVECACSACTCAFHTSNAA
jgi:hypothetical protein